MKKTLLILLGITIWIVSGVSFANTSNEDNPEGIKLTAPAIVNGLTISLDKNKLILNPGRCWINDQPIAITKEIEIEVKPAGKVKISNEAFKIQTRTTANTNACTLKQCLVGGITGSPVKCLVPHSILVKSSAGQKPKLYIPGLDYLADQNFGVITRLPKSSLKENQTVYIDYDIKQKRIDTLIITSRGAVKLIPGVPSQFAPLPPVIDETNLILANILVDPDKKFLSEQDIYPVASRKNTSINKEQKEKNRIALKKTIRKLKSGQNTNIVFWGDGITTGELASKPEKSFAYLLAGKIRQKFPTCRVTASNLGLSGSNISMRAANFEQEVLSRHPDLIIIEFANDYTLPEEMLKSNYQAVISKALGAGSEVLICSPHMPAPQYLKANSWAAVARLPLIKVIHKCAKDNSIALADVTLRCQNLGKEGLAPEFILEDQSVKPNDIGHQIYSQEIMKCFE